MVKVQSFDPVEVAAYEKIRQKLLRMAETNPAIFNIPIALAGRCCVQCGEETVKEIPGRGFYCISCGHDWGRTLLGRVIG